MYALDLVEEIKQAFSFKTSVGALHPLLKRLERYHWVKCRRIQKRPHYTIQESRRSAIASWDRQKIQTELLTPWYKKFIVEIATRAKKS